MNGYEAGGEAPKRLFPRMGAWGMLLPALVWTAAFFAMPLFVMILYSFWQRADMELVTELSTANYEAFVLSASFVESLLN